jgi:hypothetical protein
LLLLLLTSPIHGLVSRPAVQRPSDDTGADAARGHPTTATTTTTSSSSGGVSAGDRRVLRLLQSLQPGHHSSHAQLLQAVAIAQPQLAGELLQGLSYQLEPKPCGAWLGCVTATGQLIAAAATGQSTLQALITQAKCQLAAWQDASSSSSRSGLLQGLLLLPDAEGPVVRSAVRACLPPVLTKVRFEPPMCAVYCLYVHGVTRDCWLGCQYGPMLQCQSWTCDNFARYGHCCQHCCHSNRLQPRPVGSPGTLIRYGSADVTNTMCQQILPVVCLYLCLCLCLYLWLRL